MQPSRDLALRFRAHEAADEAALAAMMRELSREGAGIRPTSDEKVARMFEHLHANAGNGHCFVAEDAGAGALAGYALLFPCWSSEYGGLLLVLDELYVAPPMRSRGIGSQLLTWVERFARRRGYVAISFIVVDTNERAAGFYAKNGYSRLRVAAFDKLLEG